jgi:hypothetical protein
MRLLAGAGSAANQIEYTTKYGSALPVFFTEEEGSREGMGAAAPQEASAVNSEGGKKPSADDIASSKF